MRFDTVEELAAKLLEEGWVFEKRNLMGMSHGSSFLVIEPPSGDDIGLVGFLDASGEVSYVSLDEVEIMTDPDRIVIEL